MTIRKLARNNSGQALIETALILPLLLTIVLNAINFAFFFLMALNITSSSRSSGIYSIMGGATPAAQAVPQAGPYDTNTSVSYLAYQDLTGAVYTPTPTNTGVNVCSSTVGVSGTGGATVTTCTSSGIGGGFPTSADADPEAPAFLMGRVDVAYKFSPPIPLTPFNALLLLATNCTSSGGTVTCTFYRHVVMREMQ
jgi:Flp pilus assembly protein TadG